MSGAAKTHCPRLQSKKAVVRLRAFGVVTRMAYENVLKNPGEFDFEIQQLGEATWTNPSSQEIFVDDSEKIVFSSQLKNLNYQLKACEQLPAFEKAGARTKIFHNPASPRAAIITCGGLCPGLNNVIKGLVNVLEQDYKGKRHFGHSLWLQGLTTQSNHDPIVNSSVVDRFTQENHSCSHAGTRTRNPCGRATNKKD